MKKVLIFLTLSLIFALADHKECYSGKGVLISDTCLDPRQISVVDVDHDLSCLSADYLCTELDTLGFCSEEEMMNNVSIKVFTFVAECEDYLNESVAFFSDIQCCNETLCNTPEHELCKVKKCYNGTVVGKAGCVDPLLLTEEDVIGNDTLCIAYGVDCSMMNESCTEDEVNNGTMKWLLSFGSQSACNSLKSKYDNVTCCGTEHCNIPLEGICDSIDCFIGVSNYLEVGCVDDTNIHKFKYKIDEYVCASYIFTCSENDTGCTQEDIDNSVEKIALAAVSPSECQDFENNINYKNVTCCTTNLCNDVSVECFGKQCYAGVTIEDNSTGCIDTVGLYHIHQNATYKCISYQYKCLSNDSACSAKEIREGKFKWRFSISLPDFCLNLIRNPMAKNVTCCEENLCNEPAKGFCPINEDIECFDGYITSGKDNCVNETLLSSKKAQNTSATQCISYLHKCKSDDSFCTQEEIDTGIKKWIFRAGNDYDCSQIRGPLGAEYLTCCGTNNCNFPWFGYCKNITVSTNTIPSTTATNTKKTSITINRDTTGEGTIKYLSLILLLITYLIL